MRGARFGTWYATSTSPITAVVLPSSLLNVSRYCRNRAAGDVTGTNSVAETSSLHLLHPASSGSARLPLRVATVRADPFGKEPWSCILPNWLIWDASSTGLVYVPVRA